MQKCSSHTSFNKRNKRTYAQWFEHATLVVLVRLSRSTVRLRTNTTDGLEQYHFHSIGTLREHTKGVGGISISI